MPPFFLTVFNNVFDAKQRYLELYNSGALCLYEKGIYDAMYKIIKELNLEAEFKSYEEMRLEAKRK